MKAFKIFWFLLLLFSTGATGYAQCVPASTAAGAIDTCFGTGGKVITDITADRDYSRALALQSDGKIVVAGISGYSATVGNADFTVVRYNTDGSLDTTFDGDGIVRTDFSAWTENDDDYCRGLAIQPDGKIIVGGRSFVTPTTYALAVIRYNTDGSLDTTFDGDGKAQFEMAAIVEMYAFALQPDGKIIVGGRSFLNGTFTGILARFNSNGSVDTSFGTNGSTTASIAGIFSVALQSDGKIVAAGSQGADAAAPAFAVSRLNPNGSPDIFFGNNGVVTHHPTLNDQTWFVKIRSDNQIFIGGHSQAVPGNTRGSLLRFGSDGTLAQSTIASPDNVAFWNSTFQPDGKLLTVGWSIDPASGFTIRRWMDINIPDTTFGGGAVPVKFLPTAIPEASGVNAILVTPDKKIIVAGSVTEQDNQTTGWRWAITRLYSGLAPRAAPFDFDGDSKTDISIFRPSLGEWWILRSSNGGNFAAQFGNSSHKITPGDFTGDGKTDIAIWHPTGDWFVLRSEDLSFYSFPFGTSGDVPQVGDFDGDGKDDNGVFRPSSSTWFIRRSSDGGATIQQFGAGGDIPVAADYDGDGKSDLAIFRPSNGQWWLNRSTAGVIVFSFGTSTDKLTPGDFTGDAKADVAFFRPSTGEWFVLRSEDQSYYSFPFGASGDVPAPGDYDGDGKFDASVFRPSSATWFVQRTTAGTLIQQFGLSSDVPVPNAFVP